jgi:Family of unknown function (DUF6510)
MTMSIDERGGSLPLDGNAAAGLLAQVFACEMTVAVVTCVGCGAAAPVGAARVSGSAMGTIIRCAHCDTAVLRLARTPRGLWLDMRGARSIRVPDNR